MSDKKHVSPSQIETLSKCNQQWKFRYIDKLIVPPRMAMVKGSANHSAPEFNFGQKITSGVDLPKKDIVDYAVADLDIRLQKETVELTAEEKSIGKDNVIGDARDDVARVSGGYADLIAPLYQPERVEHRFEFPLTDEWNFLGIIDWMGVVLEDNRRIIADMKSGKNAPDPTTETKGILYALSNYRQTEEWLPYRIEHLTSTSTDPVTRKRLPEKIVVRKSQEAQFDDSDIHPAISRLQSAISTMDNLYAGGEPQFAPNSAWWCSPEWCGYWNICPAIPTRLKNKKG